MPIKRITPKRNAHSYLNKQLKIWIDTILRNLVNVGETALEEAEKAHKYNDITGNLTSSIGYAVVVDGKIYKQGGFKIIKDGRLGAREGRKLLRQLTANASEGIVFIMVAGMPYAKYVEAMSLDVLDSANITVEKMLPKIFTSLKL